jgi:hypothetical protein
LKLHIREQQPHPQPPTSSKEDKGNLAAPRSLLARCSQPLSTNQTPHPTTKRGDNNHTQTKPRRHPRKGDHRFRFPIEQGKEATRACCLKAQ